MHGIAWYGFGDPGTGMVEGLRQGSDSQTLDFATVVRRMKALGFNTIKLPFCFGTLLASSVPSYTESCTVASDATLMSNLEESSKGGFISACCMLHKSCAYSTFFSHTRSQLSSRDNSCSSNCLVLKCMWIPGRLYEHECIHISLCRLQEPGKLYELPLI